MKAPSGELEAAGAFDALENAGAQVAFWVRNRDDRGMALVLEMMMVALDPRQGPTGGLELADDLARTFHEDSLQLASCTASWERLQLTFRGTTALPRAARLPCQDEGTPAKGLRLFAGIRHDDAPECQALLPQVCACGLPNMN